MLLLTKAFDYLNRDSLWCKILYNGICGKIIDMIQSMYSGVKSVVKYLGRSLEDIHSYLGSTTGRLSVSIFILFICY